MIQIKQVRDKPSWFGIFEVCVDAAMIGRILAPLATLITLTPAVAATDEQRGKTFAQQLRQVPPIDKVTSGAQIAPPFPNLHKRYPSKPG